jgi:hypothetical protein
MDFDWFAATKSLSWDSPKLEVRIHPFDAKPTVVVRLTSSSYRVRLMIDKPTGPFDPGFG